MCIAVVLLALHHILCSQFSYDGQDDMLGTCEGGRCSWVSTAVGCVIALMQIIYQLLLFCVSEREAPQESEFKYNTLFSLSSSRQQTRNFQTPNKVKSTSIGLVNIQKTWFPRARAKQLSHRMLRYPSEKRAFTEGVFKWLHAQ